MNQKTGNDSKKSANRRKILTIIATIVIIIIVVLSIISYMIAEDKDRSPKIYGAIEINPNRITEEEKLNITLYFTNGGSVAITIDQINMSYFRYEQYYYLDVVDELDDGWITGSVLPNQTIMIYQNSYDHINPLGNCEVIAEFHTSSGIYTAKQIFTTIR